MLVANGCIAHAGDLTETERHIGVPFATLTGRADYDGQLIHVYSDHRPLRPNTNFRHKKRYRYIQCSPSPSHCHWSSIAWINRGLPIIYVNICGSGSHFGSCSLLLELSLWSREIITDMRKSWISAPNQSGNVVAVAGSLGVLFLDTSLFTAALGRFSGFWAVDFSMT